MVVRNAFCSVSVILIKWTVGRFVQKEPWIFMLQNIRWLQNLSWNCEMLRISVWGTCMRRFRRLKGISIAQHFMWKFNIPPELFYELHQRVFILLIIYSLDFFFKCVFRDSLRVSRSDELELTGTEQAAGFGALRLLRLFRLLQVSSLRQADVRKETEQFLHAKNAVVRLVTPCGSCKNRLCVLGLLNYV
jgi:hypothetical protein